MTKLNEILDARELAFDLQAGYIRERQHPRDTALTIFNYTEKAQYEHAWTHAARTCRGLIVDGSDGTVVARPWPKFFNYGEYDAGLLDLNARGVEVTDKADGSLGILYAGSDGWAIATRGSFESDQAIHATDLLRTKYLGGSSLFPWQPVPGYTYLFEIIYPANRIVLNYGDADELRLLSVIETGTGTIFGPTWDNRWPGPVTEVFPAHNLATALSMPPRPNAEGVVVRYVHTGFMVKIKQDDYVRLHRLVTGLSERRVWEHLRDNVGDYTGLLADLPDEFHGWVEDHAEALIDDFEDLMGLAHDGYEAILNNLPEDFERGDFAALAKEYTVTRPLLFLLLDGRSLSSSIWKMIKPVGNVPMTTGSEDTA